MEVTIAAIDVAELLILIISDKLAPRSRCDLLGMTISHPGSTFGYRLKNIPVLRVVATCPFI